MQTTSAFALLDAARRRTGRLMDVAGLGPAGTPYRRVMERPPMRLRGYGRRGDGPVLLLVPAPIKRAYIWDLRPSFSAVKLCLARGLRLYLVEWLDPRPEDDELGLAAYGDDLLGAALDAIAAETGERRVVLAGHSLGGTLAAIFATRRPERVRGLVLLDAPLAFGDAVGPLAAAAKAAAHPRRVREIAGSPIPGSYLGLLAAATAPEEFVLHRWAGPAADSDAAGLRLAVERWALDELAFPGRLFEEVLELLYREDRFAAGRLTLGGRRLDLAKLRCPTLAAVNPRSTVVPPASALGGFAAGMPLEAIRYDAGGCAVPHLGALAAPASYARLWPTILDWILAQGGRR